MIPIKKYYFLSPVFTILAGCTKLEEDLESTLTGPQTAAALGAELLLQTAYVDIATPFTDQSSIFSLEEYHR